MSRDDAAPGEPAAPGGPTGGPSDEPSPVGLLVVDKPLGPTSMDVCRRVRRALVAAGAPKRIRVGHGGTLDPLASGVLVVLVGRAATRLSDSIMAGEKVYDATLDLARRSATDDLEGPVEEVRIPAMPSEAALRDVLRAHTGVVLQRPPLYSAVKVGGRRAYAEARAGRAPDPQPRPVHIHEIELIDYAFPVARLVVRCGKGVYIRSLARDVGAALGVGGMLTTLRRTRVGPFDLPAARALDALPPVLHHADLQPIAPQPQRERCGD